MRRPPIRDKNRSVSRTLRPNLKTSQTVSKSSLLCQVNLISTTQTTQPTACSCSLKPGTDQISKQIITPLHPRCLCMHILKQVCKWEVSHRRHRRTWPTEMEGPSAQLLAEASVK